LKKKKNCSDDLKLATTTKTKGERRTDKRLARHTLNLPNRDANGSRLNKTAVFLKIGASGLDRTEKIFVV